MLDYARAVVREMSIDDEEFRVGFLIYSDGAYRQFYLNDRMTKADVLNGIDAVSNFNFIYITLFYNFERLSLFCGQAKRLEVKI